jgi:hypothetical protein
MKILNPLKAAFGKGRFSRVKDVSYHQWEDAFGVEFEDGLSFLEPHSAIRKANRISANAIVQRVALDEELRHGFFIHYDTGEVAEVSWAFIRELPPKKVAKPKTSSKRLRSVALLLALF